jgi:hypothetical protein
LDLQKWKESDENVQEEMEASEVSSSQLEERKFSEKRKRKKLV